MESMESPRFSNVNKDNEVNPQHNKVLAGIFVVVITVATLFTFGLFRQISDINKVWLGASVSFCPPNKSIHVDKSEIRVNVETGQEYYPVTCK